jgi:hypothetical protein
VPGTVPGTVVVPYGVLSAMPPAPR